MKITALPVAISAISASVSACDESSVSVCRDATYTINVPENQLCAGPTSENPHGTACPKKGDVASDRCYSYLKSWDEYEDKCIAPEDAQCMKLNSGAWGCVFPSVGCDTPKPETTTSTTLKPTTSTTTSTTSKPTTTSTDKCYRPLNYQGCNQDSIKCGTFGGFELVCNTDGNPGGQCRCDPSDQGCNDAVMYHNVTSTPGFLPQFGTECNKAAGCKGYGQLCNTAVGNCKECAEDVQCVANRDNFYQCHTCSSCKEQGGYFDCSAVCAE